MTALFFAALGMAIFLFGIYQKRRVLAMAKWRQAIGTVGRTAIKEDITTDEEGFSRKVMYRPVLEYQYVVDGATYTGWRIGLNAVSYSNSTRAEAQMAAYQPGTQVPVYYNPEKPADCVLVRRAPGSNFLLLLGAGMLGLVIIGVRQGRF